MRRRGRPRHPDILTPREWEVLALVRQGFSNDAIAARLGISVSGAKYHVSEILAKLDVSSRDDAANAELDRRAPLLVLLMETRRLSHLAGVASGSLALGVVVVGLVWALAASKPIRDQQSSDWMNISLPQGEVPVCADDALEGWCRRDDSTGVTIPDGYARAAAPVMIGKVPAPCPREFGRMVGARCFAWPTEPFDLIETPSRLLTDGVNPYPVRTVPADGRTPIRVARDVYVVGSYLSPLGADVPVLAVSPPDVQRIRERVANGTPMMANPKSMVVLRIENWTDVTVGEDFDLFAPAGNGWSRSGSVGTVVETVDDGSGSTRVAFMMPLSEAMLWRGPEIDQLLYRVAAAE